MSATTDSAKGMYRNPAVFARFPDLIAAESTRYGGVSPLPFASLNLGINTTDDPDHVDENRRRFFTAIGADINQFASAHQVHGTEVFRATRSGRFEGYDALVTNQPGLFVGVTVADCVPILIYDSINRSVAAIHAGWRGTAGGIVQKTLAFMQQQFGTVANHCCAYVGTCIDECSFEVGPEVADQFSAAFKRADGSKYHIDLKAANAQALRESGTPEEQISVSSFSTVLHNDEYFSYRAEKGQTGRMLAVIGLKA